MAHLFYAREDGTSSSTTRYESGGPGGRVWGGDLETPGAEQNMAWRLRSGQGGSGRESQSHSAPLSRRPAWPRAPAYLGETH